MGRKWPDWVDEIVAHLASVVGGPWGVSGGRQHRLCWFLDEETRPKRRKKILIEVQKFRLRTLGSLRCFSQDGMAKNSF